MIGRGSMSEMNTRTKERVELDDYQCCPNCGHIGILHQSKYNKCIGLSSLDNGLGTYCGCKTKRNLRI